MKPDEPTEQNAPFCNYDNKYNSIDAARRYCFNKKHRLIILLKNTRTDKIKTARNNLIPIVFIYTKIRTYACSTCVIIQYLFIDRQTYVDSNYTTIAVEKFTHKLVSGKNIRELSEHYVRTYVRALSSTL